MKDPLLRIKYMGYCLSQLPPQGAVRTFDDFVRNAKFQLCVLSKRLMNDPIWESYSDEQILVEYYGHVFAKDKEERERFEAILQGGDPDLVDWMVQSAEAENDKIKKMGEEQEESIKFNPSSLGDE